MNLNFAAVFALMAIHVGVVLATEPPIVLYTFDAESGDIIDRSPVGKPLNLKIDQPQAVRRAKGSLEFRDPVRVKSDGPASKLIRAVRSSRQLSIAVWLSSANTSQKGPARIVTLSRDPNSRNFTFGQDGDRWDFRLRTTRTSKNGIPSLASPSRSVRSGMSFVVYTRDRSGKSRLFVDGKQRADKSISGDMSNWDAGYSLALGNELTGDRPWLGSMHRVAIYDRVLTFEEITAQFKAGAAMDTKLVSANRRAEFFEQHIAPLLSHHCLECHDASTREGGLDLSRKSLALAGGDSGRAILAGKSGESLLWHSVESDEMPQDRDPLNPAEKKLLRQWIDEGAVWLLPVIDPAVYVHDSSGSAQWIQRLTVKEYVATVQATFGVDISKEAQKLLPQELRADGFSNTAYNLTVDLGHVEAYAKLAEKIVDQLDTVQFASRFSRSKRLTDDDARRLITNMGKWILRGPLTDEELVLFRGVSTTVMLAGGDFESAVGYVIEAMIQSPRFVYRIETHRGDGSAWPVTDHELANRLSYIIWGSSPDEELMRLASDGKLSGKTLSEQVDRMLDDARTQQRSVDFISQFLDLDRLDNLRPSTDLYPNWTPELASDMRQETIAFFREVAWQQNRPMSDLMNAQVTFLTPRLAKHYGLQAQGDRLTRYDLSDVPERGGLLTQGSVLTIGGDGASMVSRGLFVMHDLLRGVIKDPPPCVDTTPVPTRKGLTQRAIAESRVKDANCGGCHGKFEPLAFGLEKYDGLGAFGRSDRHGNALRDDGAILVPGSESAVTYDSAGTLMDLLAQSDRVQSTFVWKLAQFSLGRPLGGADAAIMDRVVEQAANDGGTYRDMLRAIVMSDLVQTIRTESEVED